MARRTNSPGNNGLLLLGLLAGALVGGAVGLVYTPTNGEENRKRMATWASNRASDAQGKVKQALPT